MNRYRPNPPGFGWWLIPCVLVGLTSCAAIVVDFTRYVQLP